MAARSKRGGKRPGAGRPIGHVLPPITRERIRSGVLLDIVEKAAEGKLRGSSDMVGVRVRAALGLLAKCLPDLKATDVTSGGQPLTIVRRVFKQPTDEVTTPEQQAGARDDEHPDDHGSADDG